jgi:hypothetical protein
MSAAGPGSSASVGLATTEQPHATLERPWLGLAYFTEADHDYFYGRDAEVRELSDRVRRASLTVLYGIGCWGATEQKIAVRRSVFWTHGVFSYSGGSPSSARNAVRSSR